MLARLAQALQKGDHPAAHALLQQLLRDRPDDPNVRLLGAILDRREGRLEPSHATLVALRAAFPENAGIAFQLGNTLKSLQRLEEAITQFRAALELRPRDADAAYNLACCFESTDPISAGRWFLSAARHDPKPAEALQRALYCAIRLASAAPPSLASLQSIETDSNTLISVICCSIDTEKFARLRANLAALLDGTAWELIHIPDARSLAEGYNRGLRQARGEAIVLCHDDIRVLAPDFRARLLEHLRHFDLIGAVGTTRCIGPGWFWTGPPHLHGWVVHRDADGGVYAALCSAAGPVIKGAQALDGMFLAARRELLDRLPFDAHTFDGFHLYDMDLSWRAHRAGACVGICADLLIEHASRGRYGPDWARYADRFRIKFPQFGRSSQSLIPSLIQVQVDDDDDLLRSVYAWIAHWLRQIDANEEHPASLKASSQGNQHAV